MKSGLLSVTFIALLVPAAQAGEIRVSYSPDFTARLEEEYGIREGEVLSRRIKHDLERELERIGTDPARIDVVIRDARPSRPTFKQAGDRPGLDMFRSVSTGGMDLQAIAYDDEGSTVSELSYEWYETDITQAGLTTWHDASRASDRFARRFARTLGKE